VLSPLYKLPKNHPEQPKNQAKTTKYLVVQRRNRRIIKY
jgi:hypothetical protein